MVLRMPRPEKSKSGIYYFRMRVPQHLIPLVGTDVVKRSLNTRDPREATIAHARVLQEVKARWVQLSAGVISLTQKQAVAMSGEIYRTMVAENEDNPGDPIMREGALLEDHLQLRPDRVKVVQITKDADLFQRTLENLKARRNDKAINAYLERHGYRVDPQSMELLRKAVGTAVMQAKEHLLKLSEGDFRPDPDSDRFPPLELIVKQATKNPETETADKYSLIRVFEDYMKERKATPPTYKKWKGIIGKAALEVPDIRDLTSDWIIDWKDRLLKSGLSAVSVKDGYLACLKSTCNWAKANRRISTNPVDGITVALPRKKTTREKFFTHKELKTILTATLGSPPDRCGPEMKAAYRWIPWLCAYTGARVGEIAQLRKQDVQYHDGHPLIWITPEAGTTKDGNARFVAVHSHLVEQGFLDFVRSRRTGPLFYDPSRHRGGTQGNPQYNKVGERLAKWVRELGIDDTRIRPNHAWRHLFKTEARGVLMDVGTRDYMQGHVPATEGEAYGGFKPHVLAHAIAKLPRFELE
jgi:integrase